MPKIKHSCIEDIKARVNIYDVVSGYVSLKKTGRSFKGLSPFTNEKTPSFFVHPDKNFFYCFSTTQGGDIFKFIQIVENLSFPEAAEFIANRFSIPIEYDDNGENYAMSSSLRKQMFDIHADAAEWYAQNFFDDTPEAKEMRDYWVNERGFSLEDARILKIGYAPPNSVGLKKIIAKKGYSTEAIIASGLFSAKPYETLRDFYPRFRGRLMIPICDIQGRIIAFTARKTRFTPDLPSEEGKYVNSRETEIFKKNSVAFNLDKAKDAIREKNICILVEGQLDAIRMFCAGFRNTIATQGTASTPEHFALIKRFANKVVLLYDGDKAGRAAANRVIPLCFSADIEPLVAVLPDGEDPDTYIKKYGVEAMSELTGNKLTTPIKFATNSLLEGIKNPSVGDKHGVMLKLFEMINKCQSRIVRDDYLREVSNTLLLDHASLVADFKKFLDSPQARADSQHLADDKSSSKKDSYAMLTNAVYDALMVCLYNDSVAESMANIIQDTWITETSSQANALKKLLSLYREGIGFDATETETYFETPEEKSLIYKILAAQRAEIESPVRMANECIAKIYNNFIKKEMANLNRRLADADKVNSSEKFDLMRQLKNLRNLASNPPASIKVE